MKGLWSRFLEIDLGRETFCEWSIPADWAGLHLGGRGIGARYLLKERLRLPSAPTDERLKHLELHDVSGLIPRHNGSDQ